MKNKFWFGFVFSFLIFFTSRDAFAVDGYYVGAEVGNHFGFTGSTGLKHGSGIGFGIDLGIRTNPILDLTLQSQISSHSNDVTLYSEVLSADLHIFEYNDFDVSIGAGPGFYFFKTSLGTDTNFGLNMGSNIDVIVSDNVRVGVSGRYHHIFSPGIGGNFWTFMMRLGYLFPAE